MAEPIWEEDVVIPIGGTFSKGFALTDLDTGLAADPSGWSARSEVRTAYTGPLITRFHSDRTGHANWPGVITFEVLSSGANVWLTLDATQTILLTPGVGVYDLELLEPSTLKPWRRAKGRAFFTPEATTDA